MFEIFIALFGIAFYSLILSGEKASVSQARRRSNDAETRRDQWIESVTDEELEKELRLFISRPENQDAVLDEVSDVYNEILDGKRLDEVFQRWMWCKPKRGWSDAFHEEVQKMVCMRDSNNALRIMMARRGKLPHWDASDGAWRKLKPASKMEAYLLKWCAEELRRHGIGESFYFPDDPTSMCAPAGKGMGWIL